jgi:hypothetical protein
MGLVVVVLRRYGLKSRQSAQSSSNKLLFEFMRYTVGLTPLSKPGVTRAVCAALGFFKVSRSRM